MFLITVISNVAKIHCTLFFLISPDTLTMESKFARLRQRDTSVSMLRVKMSRRKSQSQKENRERVVNTRRQLDMVPELDMSSLDASIAATNMSIFQEKTNAKSAKSMYMICITQTKPCTVLS